MEEVSSAYLLTIWSSFPWKVTVGEMSQSIDLIFFFFKWERREEEGCCSLSQNTQDILKPYLRHSLQDVDELHSVD